MDKLDKKDRLLLSVLAKNCRSSNAQIGKQIGLSREVVAYRIKRLEEQGIIKGYTAEISFNRLGFAAYTISLKLQNITKESETLIVKKLIENKKIVFIQKTLSKYDFTFTLLVKSISELNDESKKIREIIGKSLKFIEIEAFVGDYDFLASFFSERLKEKPEINFVDGNLVEIDDKDAKIIEELVENSRKTAVELSKKLKMSVFAIADRIKKLVDRKVILAFRPIIDNQKLGYYRYTLLLNFFDKERENELISFCKNHNNIWDIGIYMGNYNYVVEVFSEDNERFKGIVSDLINKFSASIIDYETLIILEELKHKYFFV